MKAKKWLLSIVVLIILGSNVMFTSLANAYEKLYDGKMITYLLEEGDLLFARTGASVGKTYLYRQYDGTVYFAGFLIRARIGESADPEFVYQATLTDAYKKYVAITSQRSGQPGVNAQEYADYQLMLPSRKEQQQIGMTLRSLDNLITLHQREPRFADTG